MCLSKELKSRDNEHSIDDTIIEFVRKTGEPMITNLIAEVNDAMQETSPVLSAFDLFNPDAVFKDDKSRKEFFNTLTDHYGQPKTDRFENDTVTGIPIINSVQATIEYDDFMEEFDSAVATPNENLKKSVKQLVAAKQIKSEEVESYIRSHKPTSTDVYKFLAADGTLQNCSNIAILLKISLLIPPSTSNVERGFSVMNLICTPLRSSLNEQNLDRFMRICINGPEKLNDDMLNQLIQDFKKANDNRRLEL